MTSDRPILVIVCGGTIVMRRKQSQGLDVGSVADAEDALQGLIATAKALSPLRVRYLMAVDSTDMNPGHWEEVANAIVAEGEGIRGVVVLCGTNTLAYLSSALSFALQGIQLPVIVTGSQLPAYEPFTDATLNVLNSIRVSTMTLNGVYVVFGHRIILGCRAKKVSESQFNAFASFNSEDIGEIGVEIRLRCAVGPVNEGHNRDRHGRRIRFSPDVVCLTVLPGLSTKVVCSVIDAGCKGLIMRSFGSGDIPRTLFPALEYARKHQVPVINTTQCRGSTFMGINEVGRLALDYGIVQAFDMSMETMSTKLMWLLGQSHSYEEIQHLMHENLVGEIDALREAK